MNAVSAISALAVCMLLAQSSAAQSVPTPVHWSTGKSIREPRGRVSVEVLAAIDSGWHLYALAGPDESPLATEIAIAKDDPAELLRVDQGRPKRLPADPSLVFDGSARFGVHLKPTAQSAGSAVHVLIRYQACNDRMCLPVRHETLVVPLR